MGADTQSRDAGRFRCRAPGFPMSVDRVAVAPSRAFLALLLLSGCAGPGEGPEPRPLAPGEPLEGFRADVREGFESWAALVPPDCKSPTMDPLTSWCSASAPPDDWKVTSGGRWGDMVGRMWETHSGTHALFFHGCSYLPEYRETWCAPVEMRGPTFLAAPGPYRLAWSVQRRPHVGWTPPGYVAPMSSTLRVLFLGAGCSDVLGEASAPAPDGAANGAWVEPSATVTAPPGTACARFVLAVGLEARGLYVDDLGLSPLP